MARAAKESGLELLAITDHGPAMPGSACHMHFQNIYICPEELEGVQMLYGAELNILDSAGQLDLPPEVCQKLDITIASIHGPCFNSAPTLENITQAYLCAMEKPYVNIIGHPDDARFPVDAEALVKGARDTHTLIEVNNASLMPNGFRINTYGTMLNILKLCKKYEVCVTTSGDAHFDTYVGKKQYVEQILKEADFPEELIVTTDIEKLKPYLNKYSK
jgi:putative hydrolase